MSSSTKKHTSSSTTNSTNNTNNISLLALVVALLLMAFAMPSFIQRLFRPMSTAMGITGTNGGGTPRPVIPEGAEKATVGAGCFWGVEHLYRKHFGDKGLYDARVGYIGGDTTNPSYRQVCSGKTGRKSIEPNF